MDPLSASLAATVLFDQVREAIQVLENVREPLMSLRDFKGDLEKLKVHLQQLADAVAILDKSSTDYPPSAQTALARCMSQQAELIKSLRVMRKTFEKGQYQSRWDFREQMSLERSFKNVSTEINSLCKSIELFANIVFSSLPKIPRESGFWDSGQMVFADGDSSIFTDIEAPIVPQEFADLVFKFVRDVSKYGNIGFPGEIPNAPIQTRPGRDIAELVISQWNVTFSAGLQDGRPYWGACRAKPDTGCNGNWIKRDVVERAGLLSFVMPVIGDPLVAVDASDHTHLAKDVISLTWYRNEERTSRKTDFFVIETGPYEMLFGMEFIQERLEGLFPEEFTREDSLRVGTILGFRFKPMSITERNDLNAARENFEQRNRELAAMGQDKEEDDTPAVENALNIPVPGIQVEIVKTQNSDLNLEQG